MEKKPGGNENTFENDDLKKKVLDEMDESELDGLSGGEGMDMGVIIKP